MNPLITVHVLSYGLQIPPQPVHVQPDGLQGLAHSPFSAWESASMLIEELLHLSCFFLGCKVLCQILDQSGEEEATL